MKFIEYLINEAKKDRPAGRRNTELQFFVDGNGPFNVMTSKGDIHDTYETHKEAQSVANQLNQKYGITR